ncbi:MAG TPA: FAD-dependent oxidoreductase [Methylibium sp.]|uniref:FAD-dependent oxidoreductase n=1 Tax=Methylibium sp. TaxID=2067992 RepID=UPI002DB848E2|nr:FAD-dependent oxidoreductase [Methylibium sp.]HEU4460443.1 FAD-dependent oxidoreductase [Methylibium sp.]
MNERIARRSLLGAGLASSALALAGCVREAAEIPGGWAGAAVDRGHRLREPAGATDAGAPARRCAVAIVGGGIAGLAAARALTRSGVDDFRLFELEDRPGGNARGHTMAGLRCPLGAHYLPLPGPEAREVSELLHELGIARSAFGRTVYDERQLVHAPQERVFVREAGTDGAAAGRWHEGLLPLEGASAATLAQLRRFAAELRGVQAELSFAMPTLRSRWSPGLAALDAQSFAAWLAARGYDDPLLLGHLDYACRDDYGAGTAMVSAWAGLHYFASRHGFHAPGEDDGGGSDGVLTWPEGNAHLAERLAATLGDRLLAGRLVTRIAPARREVELHARQAGEGRTERWVARRVIVAAPLFVAARIVDPLPAPLAALLPRLQYAPWLVTNLQLRAPLADRLLGAPPAWDNVIAGSAALGYVDAQHQALRSVPGPTVLTHYWALGGHSVQELRAQRARLLDAPWPHWRDAVLSDLAAAHPDIAAKTARIDSTRYGHAMLLPRPGLRGSAALAALAEPVGRLQFAHADLSGYSVFEEAFTRGHLAGMQAAAIL